MSEWINNQTRRKETIKNVLRQLHAGKSAADVSEEFAQLAAETTSAEIAEIEQSLIEEGLPVEEVQRLCDVHVSVFRSSLDQHPHPETVPGHPVYTFRAENQAVLKFLDEMDTAVEALVRQPSPAGFQALQSQLARLMSYELHYSRKENLLFPYLEKHGFSGPSKVMWGIHDMIRAQWKTLSGLLAQPAPDVPVKFQTLYLEMQNAIQEMVYKEEKILYPAAMEHLNLDEWAAIRAQEEEIGHFMVTPAKTPLSTPAAPVIQTAPAGVIPEGLLALQTGGLSLEQINMMLTNLPVDITFVDENDTVRYFSQTRERIFERQPAIIGRKVQNCHPPQSVGRVQQILDDFRAGKRRVAEFWIQMGPKFIHIRYFALHDFAGIYRGTIEVSQDVAGIRALQGERRLLDDRPAV